MCSSMCNTAAILSKAYTVNTFQSIYCQYFPKHILSILSKAYTVNTFQSIYCQYFPKHILSILSKAYTVNTFQSIYCQYFPVLFIRSKASAVCTTGLENTRVFRVPTTSSQRSTSTNVPRSPLSCTRNQRCFERVLLNLSFAYKH